jgi:hypothetical protein
MVFVMDRQILCPSDGKYHTPIAVWSSRRHRDHRLYLDPVIYVFRLVFRAVIHLNWQITVSNRPADCGLLLADPLSRGGFLLDSIHHVVPAGHYTPTAFFGLLNRESISPYRRFLLVLLAILIPGTSEINLLIFLFVLFGIIAFRMILRKQISRLFLWLFFAAIIMSLFSLMSPGNSGRAQMIAQNAEATPIQNLPFAIREGLALAKSELLFHFTRSPLLLFTLLLVLIRSSFAILRNIEPKGWMVLLFWLSALSIYVFLHIPYIYQTGILHIPGRVSNVIHLYFLIAWSSGILLTSSYLLGHYDFEDKGLILTTTGIILSYCMLQLTIPNKIEHAWMDKLTGKAAAYDAAQNERIRFMQSAVGQSVIVSPLSVKPSSIFLVDLEMDPVDWKNQAYAKYYGLKSIQLGDSNKVILP